MFKFVTCVATAFRIQSESLVEEATASKPAKDDYNRLYTGKPDIKLHLWQIDLNKDREKKGKLLPGWTAHHAFYSRGGWQFDYNLYNGTM